MASRGRGRGRGRAIPIGKGSGATTKLHLSTGIEPPPSFPAITLPNPMQLGSNETYLLRKNEHFKQRFRQSLSFLTGERPKTDIERYGVPIELNPPQEAFFEDLNVKSGLYPDELLAPKYRTGRKRKPSEVKDDPTKKKWKSTSKSKPPKTKKTKGEPETTVIKVLKATRVKKEKSVEVHAEDAIVIKRKMKNTNRIEEDPVEFAGAALSLEMLDAEEIVPLDVLEAKDQQALNQDETEEQEEKKEEGGEEDLQEEENEDLLDADDDYVKDYYADGDDDDEAGEDDDQEPTF